MIMSTQSYIQESTKNSMQLDVEEFMRRCDQEVKTYPEIPDEKVKTLRIRLMMEELMGATKPYVEYNLIQNKSDELVASILKNDIVGIADGIADVLYVVIGTAAAYGIDIQEVFDEVHRSNLSKTVWDEERQRWYIEKDEFGKAIKPESYSPADLEPIIQRQIDNGKARDA